MSYELKDYLNAINYTKEKLMSGDDEMWEKKYPPYVVNKCLAAHQDCVLLVNELNMRPGMSHKMQFDFLLNSLRPRKRFEPWLRNKVQENLEYVKEYYGYSNRKAEEALKILDDEQIKTIKSSLNKGGKNGN